MSMFVLDCSVTMGNTLVMLLGGGTKARQARDIATAQACWQAYKQERRHARQSSSGE